MNSVNVCLLGYKIHVELPKIGSKEQLVVNTINPHSYSVAIDDVIFKKALLESDVLMPDGVGIVFAVRFLLNRRIRKIAGWDIHTHYLNEADNKGLRVFYLGASQDTLNKISVRLSLEYPRCEVGFYSPPFKQIFNEGDNLRMINEINSFKPDILFVGMTAPKQEKWVFSNKNSIDARIICSIGAVFDFYAGTVKRSHWIWIKFGLEWLPRLLKEPRRLARRNFISTPRFLFDVFKEKLLNDKV